MARGAQTCPACGSALEIQRLGCACGTVVEGRFRWPRLARLEAGDQQFVELMILTSGSLKAVAKRLGVSYPTVRKRLDALILRFEQEVQRDEEHRRSLLEAVARGQASSADATRELE